MHCCERLYETITELSKEDNNKLMPTYKGTGSS